MAKISLNGPLAMDQSSSVKQLPVLSPCRRLPKKYKNRPLFIARVHFFKFLGVRLPTWSKVTCKRILCNIIYYFAVNDMKMFNESVDASNFFFGRNIVCIWMCILWASGGADVHDADRNTASDQPGTPWVISVLQIRFHITCNSLYLFLHNLLNKIAKSFEASSFQLVFKSLLNFCQNSTRI